MKTSFKFYLISILSCFSICVGCNNIPESNISGDSDATFNIISMRRDTKTNVIEVRLDAFPSEWGNWKMYLNGKETAMEGGAGQIVVRPNAALDSSPTGLFIGTLPWLTGLDRIDFPMVGSLQFSIPGQGHSNFFHYNLKDQIVDDDPSEENVQPWISHNGDLVIENGETMTIENEKYLQEGNIYANDHSKLIIKDSQLMMGRGDVPTIHVYIIIAPEALVEIEGSKIFPESGLVCVLNKGKVTITDSPTSIHYFDMSDGASLTMINSQMVFTIGGLLQVMGGHTTVINSTIGALGIKVPAGAHLNVSNLASGTYLDSWDVHSMIPEADYTLTLTKTTILKDDFTGDLAHGPYERGWIFFLDPDAHVRISNSELRKVFIDIVNDNATFHDLKVGIPSSLTYRDIELSNVTVMGQWPFTIKDSHITVNNSDYLFLQPTGNSTVTLNNSHMCEFIPRDFMGAMEFNNAMWTTAGEIIGGVAYHSMSNDFSMKGSLTIDSAVQNNLQWKDATVTREYEIHIAKKDGSPVEGAIVHVNGETAVSDSLGVAKISIRFDESNFKQQYMLKIKAPNTSEIEHTVSFFSETPIRITLE